MIESSQLPSASNLITELQGRLSYWHDRLTFYNDFNALDKAHVQEQLETVIQIVDELYTVIHEENKWMK